MLSVVHVATAFYGTVAVTDWTMSFLVDDIYGAFTKGVALSVLILTESSHETAKESITVFPISQMRKLRLKSPNAPMQQSQNSDPGWANSSTYWSNDLATRTTEGGGKGQTRRIVAGQECKGQHTVFSSVQ